MTMDLKEELIKECKRQEESCLYTSTSLFICLRCLRSVKVLLVALPLIFGSLASSKLLIPQEVEKSHPVFALLSFLAAIIPSLYVALKFDERLEECVRLSAEFNILHHDFRYAANVYATKSTTDFEAHVSELRTRLAEARKASFTAPEWCFKRAQKKISSGDYSFSEDQKL